MTVRSNPIVRRHTSRFVFGQLPILRYKRLGFMLLLTAAFQRQSVQLVVTVVEKERSLKATWSGQRLTRDGRSWRIGERKCNVAFPQWKL